MLTEKDLDEIGEEVQRQRAAETSNVIQFHPDTVGEGFRFDADDILEAAKGQGFVTLAVIGQTEDGEIWISGNANAGETLVLMERAKRVVVFGEGD